MAQADVITIVLRFGLDTKLGLYQDTLYFSEDEWAKRDQGAIDAAKQALADTWVTFMTAQLADAAALATAKGLQDKIADIDAKVVDLEAAKVAAQAALDALNTKADDPAAAPGVQVSS